MTGADLKATRIAIGMPGTAMVEYCGVTQTTYFRYEAANKSIPSKVVIKLQNILRLRQRLVKDCLTGIDLSFPVKQKVIPVVVYSSVKDLIDAELRQAMEGIHPSILPCSAFQAKMEVLDQWYLNSKSKVSIAPEIILVWFDQNSYNRWLKLRYGLLENAENMPPARKLRHDWALSVVK
jgi:transcriptional regulator with XRE-family HTH domain